MTTTKLRLTFVSTLAVAGFLFASTALAVPSAPKVWEKCAGVSKAGKNDCGALDGSHMCAAQAKKDNSANEWVFVPKGTCDKLGGAVKEEVPADASPMPMNGHKATPAKK